MLNPINKTIELGDGRTITIETGKLAKQADGAVTVRMNNTVSVSYTHLDVYKRQLDFRAFGVFPETGVLRT